MSRSGDSTARIWTLNDGPCSSNSQKGPYDVSVLKHYRGRTNDKSKDVTTLDWNVSFLLPILLIDFDFHWRTIFHKVVSFI